MRIEEIDACSLSPLVALAQDFDSKIEQAAYYLAKEQLTSLTFRMDVVVVLEGLWS